jgi:ankyrin repeat protein
MSLQNIDLLFVVKKFYRFPSWRDWIDKTVRERPDELYKTDEDGNMPIHIASKSRYPEILDFLLPYYLTPDIKNESGETPLMCAVRAKSLNNVKRALEERCDINEVNREGKSALHIAVSLCLKDIVLFLINRGADMYASDDEGKIPYGHLPKENPEAEILKNIFYEKMVML